MTSYHRNYLHRSRRKVSNRLVRFGGELNKTPAQNQSSLPPQKPSYPYYGLAHEDNETKNTRNWMYLLLPILVIAILFINSTAGIVTAMISLGSISAFFFQKFK